MGELTIPFHRETAKKILLQHLGLGKIIPEEDGSWLMLPSLEKVSRINVLATALMKEKRGNVTDILVDDGTGQAVVRFFEPEPLIEQIQIGKALLIIGKPRTYNQEKYLSPEIIKMVLPAWLQVRKKELEQEHQILFPEPAEGISPAHRPEEGKVIIEGFEYPPKICQTLQRSTLNIDENKGYSKSSIMEQMVMPAEPAVEDISLPLEKVARLIRELDPGGGVFIEELIQKSPLPETERLVKKLLERGEIFQNAPGKVRML